MNKQNLDIPECRHDNFNNAIKKINNRAYKLKLPPLKQKFIKSFVEETTITIITDGRPKQSKIYSKYFRYEVIGDIPQIEGYNYIGVIEKLENGNKINTNEFIKVDMDKIKHYYNQPIVCNHCNTNRTRKKSIILEKDGKYIQVGRGCLKDYLGIDSLSTFTHIDTIYNLESYEIIEDGKYIPPHYKISDIVNLTDIHLQSNPYVKVDDYYSTNPPTKEVIKNELYHKSTNENLPKISDKTNQIIKYYQNKEYGNNEYINNLISFFKNEFIEEKNIGYIVASVHTHSKIIEKQEEIKLKANYYNNNQYVFEDVKKFDIECILVNYTTCENIYGTTFIYNFDYNGNKLTWFSSNSFDIPNHSKVALIGSVKGHKEFNGINQTLVTRCKIKKL